MEIFGLGALGIFLFSLWKNKTVNETTTGNHRYIPNQIQPLPTIRDPIGGYSVTQGYFPKIDFGKDNKNSIL